MTRIMEPNQLIDLVGERKIDRRGVLRALGAAGVGVATVPTMARQARASDMPTYFTWSGYDVPEMFTPFREQYGADPEFPVFSDTTEGLQKMRAGFVVDITHPCHSELLRYRASELFQPIDVDRLSHWGSVYSGLKKLRGQIDDAGVWLVPFDWGATSITYRTDLVDLDKHEESWELLWNEEFRQRMAVIIGMEDSWFVAAIREGVDMSDPEKLTEEQIEKVNAALRAQRPLVKFYWSDDTTLQQALATGELALAMTWNSTAVQLKAQGVPVEFASPKEGVLTWACGFMMHKDAPQRDKAHDLINAMLDPVVGEFIMVDYGYGHSNSATFDALTPEQIANTGLPNDPNAFLASGKFAPPIDEALATRLSRDWEQIMAGF